MYIGCYIMIYNIFLFLLFWPNIFIFLLVWQKLLQSKGFNSKEQINIKSSSDPDCITTTVKVMLQIARIINLDEVISYLLCKHNGLNS